MSVNYGAAAEFGDSGDFLAFVVYGLTGTFLHGFPACNSWLCVLYFPQRPLLEYCLHCIMNILFLDVDHLLQRESGAVGNELFLK